MRLLGYLCCLIALMGCSEKKITPPDRVALSLRMATEGASRFEDYIHSLSIYAFRKTASGIYVYAETLAELDADGVAGLKNASEKEDSKYFEAILAVGTYKLFMVGNADGQMAGELVEGVTTPAEVLLKGNADGRDSIFFLGNTDITVVGGFRPPVEITLNRAVSKLILVLYKVPVQIDSVRVELDNIAKGISIDTVTTEEGHTVGRSFPVRQTGGVDSDTIAGELITLPSVGVGSSFRIFFYARNGQVKMKEMPVQVLLPDKYIRITAIIDDSPGALLSFEVKMEVLLFDYWYERKLPDFTLNKPN